MQSRMILMEVPYPCHLVLPYDQHSRFLYLPTLTNVPLVDPVCSLKRHIRGLQEHGESLLRPHASDRIVNI